jgi:hypothetical protein
MLNFLQGLAYKPFLVRASPIALGTFPQAKTPFLQIDFMQQKILSPQASRLPANILVFQTKGQHFCDDASLFASLIPQLTNLSRPVLTSCVHPTPYRACALWMLSCESFPSQDRRKETRKFMGFSPRLVVNAMQQMRHRLASSHTAFCRKRADPGERKR